MTIFYRDGLQEEAVVLRNPSYAYMSDLIGSGSYEGNQKPISNTTLTKRNLNVGRRTGPTIQCRNTKIRRSIAIASCQSHR